MKATVITASNRAAAGVYDDTTGPLIVDALSALGFEVTGPVVVPDGQPVGEAFMVGAAGQAPTPNVLALPDGGFAIAFTGNTTTTVQRYDANGVAVGGVTSDTCDRLREDITTIDVKTLPIPDPPRLAAVRRAGRRVSRGRPWRARSRPPRPLPMQTCK